MSDKLIKEGGALFLAGLLLAAGFIYLTPLKHINVVEPTVRDIEPALFHKSFEARPDEYLFVDVRPTSVYDQNHASGSITMPLHTLYTERHFLPKRGKTIVLICSGGSASGVAYSYLEHYGFRNLRRIGGGIEAWREAGLPTEGGSGET